MLCGNARIFNTSILDATEIQFTHTNFDFSAMSQPPAITSTQQTQVKIQPQPQPIQIQFLWHL